MGLTPASLLHWLCLISVLCVSWQLCAGAAAKQLPLPASIAAVATTNRSSNSNIGTASSSRHESYDNDNDDAVIAPTLRRRRRADDWLIAPHTRWCGRGNLANGTYNHLGGASSADKCCRKHDHCKMWIPGMSTMYDLFNYRPYTLSHCTCDRRFRTCLKMASDSDEAASAIGKLFFNIVQTQCFILKTEMVCVERAKEGGNCVREEARHKAFLRNNKSF